MGTSILIKEKYSLQPSTSNFNQYAQHSKTTTVTLENLFNNLLIKDTKKMLSYRKFRRLTNSIESNSFTNKNVMIINAYHYQ